MDTLFTPIVSGMTALFGREPTLNEMILIPMIPVFVSAFLIQCSAPSACGSCVRCDNLWSGSAR